MKTLCLFLLLLVLVPFSATGETTYGVKLIAGAAAFLDESTPLDHFVIGAAGAIDLSPRLHLEPQFLYMDGPESDRDITLTGNISYDILVAKNSALYLVGGGGLLRHTEDFASGSFSSYDGTFSGGIGIRFDLSENLFVAPEFRIGFEPLIQILGSAGFRF
jgi:hypothetical protein